MPYRATHRAETRAMEGLKSLGKQTGSFTQRVIRRFGLLLYLLQGVDCVDLE